jgi:hypothetical protein
MSIKKELIEKLIKLGHINLEEALILLSDEQEAVEIDDFDDIPTDPSWVTTMSWDQNYTLTI